MKAPSASQTILLTSIVSSLVHTGLAVARPNPNHTFSLRRIPAEQGKNVASIGNNHASNGLLVDGEGNFYTPKSKNPQSNKIVSTRGAVAAIRGGSLFVDSEGNFYTPKQQPDVSEKTSMEEPLPSGTGSPAEILRGGSKNKNDKLGGLCVDSEGNLYADPTSPKPATSTRLSLLRGGSLCVDNEGNFFSPRIVKQEAAPKKIIASSNRRSHHTQGDAVLLAKNKQPHKTSNQHKKSAGGSQKKSNKDEKPISFIGYNNALMET